MNKHTYIATFKALSAIDHKPITKIYPNCTESHAMELSSIYSSLARTELDSLTIQ